MSADELNADAVEDNAVVEGTVEIDADVEDVPLESGDETATAAETPTKPRRSWLRIVAFAVLPALAVVLAVAAGYLKWQEASRDETRAAATESVAAAREITPAILSYKAESVDKDLNAVRDRLTGSFLDSYTKLINEVVIPGAKQQKISAAAQVAAAASVSATPEHAVTLLFVNQTVTMGAGGDKSAPTTTASSVRVTLDKVDGRWLVSGFDPV